MKKTKICIFATALLLTFAILPLHVFAAGNSYSWYCKRTKDHTQPQVGGDIAFVSEYGGYSIDKKHGDACEDKVIYLTFDAGYENGNVEKILNVMKRQNVSGAFFVLGNLIDKNTELVCRMFSEGHLVCNHTYSHDCMVGKTQEEFKTELERLETACAEKTGHSLAKYYRPPEGRFDENSLKYAQDMGYKTIFWSFAYADWDNNKQMSKEAAKRKILDNIHNGAVLLLHPTSATNAAVLEDIILELKSLGYRFGTLDELCSEAGE